MIVLILFSLLSPLVLALADLARATVTGNPGTFINTDGVSFTVNGSDFKYIGTNAYWLPVLNTNEDIWYTLGNISALGVKVIRLWAFNDVDTVPVNGTWFQLVSNGTVSINDGPNGLQKLDTVVQMAEKYGLYLILSLTNNWYPLPPVDDTVQPVDSATFPRHVASGTTNPLPRNYLSNDYGGMDLYVRQYGLQTHDQFYTDPSILASFMNFTTQIVSRYVNSPSVFSWELANDPRCNSTIPTSPNCTTETITQWHASVAAHVRSIDSNHLISAGTSGFLCTGCPKLYPLNPAPVPAPSMFPVPGKAKRARVSPVTTDQILRERADSRRRTRESARLAGSLKQDGTRVRGRWVSTTTRWQETQSVGSIYDGSYGVDSQDITNIPDIGFGSFMLFPDQQFYGPTDPYLDSYTNTLNAGIDWILKQAQSAAAVGKPSALTAFGLVTQSNAINFVPFNTTTAPYAADALIASSFKPTYGVTNQQQTDAYSTWFSTGITAGLGAIVQYQWGQMNLTVETGTTISPGVTGISQDPQTTQTAPSDGTTGISPNDGYSNIGNNGVQQVIQTATQQIATG